MTCQYSNLWDLLKHVKLVSQLHPLILASWPVTLILNMALNTLLGETGELNLTGVTFWSLQVITPFAVHLRKTYIHLRQQLKPFGKYTFITTSMNLITCNCNTCNYDERHYWMFFLPIVYSRNTGHRLSVHVNDWPFWINDCMKVQLIVRLYANCIIVCLIHHWLSYYAIDFLLVLMINHCARLKVQRCNCSSIDPIQC